MLSLTGTYDWDLYFYLLGCSTHQNLMSCSRILNSIKGFKLKQLQWSNITITAEVEVLCQQLKGRAMYTVPPATSTTSSSKSSGSVHFQPIDLAQKSSVQAMDQSLLNSSLNLLDDSPQLQSSSSNGPIPHGQATPRIPACKDNYPIPPTPYANQTAVDQHKRAQPTPLPPRTSLGSINVQSPKQVQPPQLPDSVQPQ